MCTFDETEDPGLVPAIRAPICKMHPMLQYVQLVWKQTFIIDHHLPCQRCHHLVSHQNSGRRDDNYNDKISTLTDFNRKALNPNERS